MDWINRLFSLRRTPEHPGTARTPNAAQVDAATACKDRGNTHWAKGEAEAAIRCYQQALSIDPGYAEAFNNIGFVYLQQQRHEDAERHLSKAISLNPKLPSAHYNLGTLFQHTGQPEQALACFREAVSLDPGFPPALYNLGLLLRQRGEQSEAMACFQRAVAFNPDLAEAYNEMGNLFLAQAKPDMAALYYRKALDVRPDDHSAHNGLGVALWKQDKLDEALACFQAAIRLMPSLVVVHNNIGDVLHKQGRLDEALVSLGKAITLDPMMPNAYITKGHVLRDQAKFSEAEACYRLALELDPGLTPLRFSIAIVLLAQGKLAAGWKDYELRFYRDSGAWGRNFPQPRWAGDELHDSTLLIWGDQGIGDDILFASMFPEIIVRVRHCVIECAPKLVTLFARSFPDALVVPRTDPPHPATLAGIDHQIAAADLARWLRPSLESFPRHDGYLIPDPARIAFWKARLAELGPGLKVGFCWRSRILNNLRRLHYTSLDQWGPIFTVPGVHFINLQYDECAAELAAARQQFGITLHNFAEVDLFNDLDEAAALTQALDLVISAPTAASGLAAATGVSTWEMGYATTWVSLGTDHVPWFPSQRLYLRKWNQPWDEIIATISEQLEAAKGEQRP